MTDYYLGININMSLTKIYIKGINNIYAHYFLSENVTYNYKIVTSIFFVVLFRKMINMNIFDKKR
jgi:hypothetical protein